MVDDPNVPPYIEFPPELGGEAGVRRMLGHRPFLPDELVSAIGRVAVNSATVTLETLAFQGSILQHTAYVEPTRFEGDNSKRVRSAPDDFERALHVLKKGLRARVRGSLWTDVQQYLAKSKRLMAQRNLIVHGMWQARPDPDGRHECQQWKSKTDQKGEVVPAPRFSVGEVNAIADQLRALSGELHGLIGEVAQAVPEMQKSMRPVASLDELRAQHDQDEAYGIA